MAENFNEFPENVRGEFLPNLIEKDMVAWRVAWYISSHFDHLPENVANELLLQLFEKGIAAGAVSWTIAKNFNKLSVNVRNLLDSDRLQKPLKKFIKNLSQDYHISGDIREEWEKDTALQLISNVWFKIDLDFILEILNKLSNDTNKKIRERAKKILKVVTE